MLQNKYKFLKLKCLKTVMILKNLCGMKKSAKLFSRGVTIHVPFDSIRFRLLPFGFDYFDSSMQNINDF